MTRQKAIEIINYHKILVDKDKSGLLDKKLEYEAIDMAVKALEQESKVGHWDKVFVPLPLSDGTKECYQCSSCGTHWEYTFKYCPNCRAKMESEIEQ